RVGLGLVDEVELERMLVLRLGRRGDASGDRFQLGVERRGGDDLTLAPQVVVDLLTELQLQIRLAAVRRRRLGLGGRGTGGAGQKYKYSEGRGEGHRGPLVRRSHRVPRTAFCTFLAPSLTRAAK